MPKRWNFADIEERFVEAIGKESRGSGRRWDHISSAHRRIATTVDLPEFDHRNHSIPTDPATDWVEVPSSWIFIYSVFDSSTDNEIYRDTNLRHHARFRETDGLPPVGAVTRYLRAEDRIYYRDRPAESVDLVFDYKYLPDNVNQADEDRIPETPAQYDEALLRFAISDYYETIPGDDEQQTLMLRQLGQASEQAGMKILGMMFDPKTEETKGRHDTMRQRGYRFDVLGR